jgi:hypothetical protein
MALTPVITSCPRAIWQADPDSELAHPAHPLEGHVGMIAELLRHPAGAADRSRPVCSDFGRGMSLS